MKRKTTFILLVLVLLGILIFKPVLFKSQNIWSGTVKFGNIDRDSSSVYGKYNEANGKGEFLFKLSKGEYKVIKNVETKEGTVSILLEDSNGNLINGLTSNETSIFINNSGSYYIKVYLYKHSGEFKVSIMKY